MIKTQLIFDFYTTFSTVNEFRVGTLVYKSSIQNLKFMATSGLSHYQGIGSCNKKGRGAIPPCEFIGIPNYTVSTKPIFMPGIRGVEGNFYQILPFEVSVIQYEKKTKRGDFGIHADKNTKGTAGCIGVSPGIHWEKFQDIMLKTLLRGEETIDLFVPRNN